MSESEDDDWRVNSDEEADDEDEEHKSKSRPCFYHFDELNIVLDAAGGDESVCLAAISRLASVPGVLPFTDVHKLARAVSELVSRDTLGSVLGAATTASAGASSAAAAGKKPLSEHEDMVLLNLLYAPRRSRLFSVLKSLARIENAAHICAWTKASNIKVCQPYP